MPYVSEMKVVLKKVFVKHAYVNLQIFDDRAAVKLAREFIGNASQERVLQLLIQPNNRLKSIVELGIGGVDYCNLDFREIFKHALLANCPHFVICHNHPSGDASPSDRDLETTKMLLAAARTMKICVLDHIIITEKSHASLATLYPEIFAEPGEIFQ